MRRLKVVVERHDDGYVAYPLGVNGVVVGQGDSYDEALADVTSAIRFHIKTFGVDALDVKSPVLEAYSAYPSNDPAASRRRSSSPKM
ncbi:MAG: type II toxin-antitoxin system HicB family antitoxin [Thermomicrobiales bacterium]